MRNRQSWIPRVVIITLTLFAVFAGRAWGGGTVMVSPARHTLVAAPKGTSTGSIVVSNRSPFDVNVMVVFRDWELGEGGILIPRAPGSLASSCASWIKFNPRSFKIPAEGRQVVRYSVSPPAGTAPGERRGVIFFEQRSKDPSGSGASLVTQVGSVLYVAVEPVERKLQVRSITAAVGTNSRLRLELDMAALGNGHCRPAGRYALWANSGKTRIEEGTIPETLILPGGAKRVEILGSTMLTPGRYRVTLELISPGLSKAYRRDLDLNVP